MIILVYLSQEVINVKFALEILLILKDKMQRIDIEKGPEGVNMQYVFTFSQHLRNKYRN